MLRELHSSKVQTVALQELLEPFLSKFTSLVTDRMFIIEGCVGYKFGYRHLSLKIINVEFDIFVLIGQNLTMKLKIRVLIIACK